MGKSTFRLSLIELFLLALLCGNSHAQISEEAEFNNYVDDCMNELEFDAFPSELNCYDGVVFDEPGFSVIRDLLVYEKINDEVDLAVACRWLFGSEESPSTAQSLEMILHNRRTGGTCFFAAKDSFDPDNQVKTVDPEMTIPTDSTAHNYWKSPSELLADDPCTECHVSGPYIASEKIAKELGQFGLLNNGHDTFAIDDGNGPFYHAVGESAFADPLNDNISDTIRHSNKNWPDGNFMTCADGCHSYVNTALSTVESKESAGVTILTSIDTVLSTLISGGYMAPTNQDSDWRWINNDTVEQWGGNDVELFAEAKNNYPRLLSSCDVPTRIEAHAVGSSLDFSDGDIFYFAGSSEKHKVIDNLAVFNLRDGLVCNNADQPPGVSCQDYTVDYLCGPDSTTPSDWWSHDADDANGNGDDESRYKAEGAGLCENPTAIRARSVKSTGGPSGTLWHYRYGPNDRLHYFAPDGLVCRDEDQGPGGKCSNYVVRYMDCADLGSPSSQAKLRSQWSSRYLTAGGTQNNDEARAQPLNGSWSSQDWLIEYVTPDIVRLKNKWTGKYLAVQNEQEASPVIGYELEPTWGSMQWRFESVSGNTIYRLKNVWTGRYLTVSDTSNYAEILAQSYNSGWTSQNWIFTFE